MNPIHCKDGPPGPHTSPVYGACSYHRIQAKWSSLWLSPTLINMKEQKATEAVTEICLLNKSEKGLVDLTDLLF